MTQKRINYTFRFIISIILFTFIVSCKDNNPGETNPDEQLPVLSAQLTMNTISATTAGYSAAITTDNAESVSMRGICWGTKTDPTVNDSVKASGRGVGAYSAILKNLTPATIYYVRAFATNQSGTKYGETISFTTRNLPTVVTTVVYNITINSASSGGSIVDNEVTVLSKGICWSTSQQPTIDLETKTNEGTGNTAFTSNIGGLTLSTTYYVRAYAVTVDGVVYGSQETFSTLAEIPKTGTVSDVEGNIYHYITIGTQRWMVENLRTSKYKNGESIGTTPTPVTNIISEQTPKYQWPCNGDESLVATYGRLYTWFVVNDSRGLAPDGWHVASDAEWTILLNYLIANGYNYDKTTTGNKTAQSLASNSGWSTGWNPTTPTGTPANDMALNNSSGLSFYPTAGRLNDGYFSIGLQTTLWTSTESDTYALSEAINNDQTYLTQHQITSKSFGWGVRCVMN